MKDFLRNLLIFIFFYNLCMVHGMKRRGFTGYMVRRSSDCNNTTLKRQGGDAHASDDMDAYRDEAMQQTSECLCGVANDEYANRIIGGSETTPNAFPWLAALYRVKYNFFYCGASVITERHIITAGHCVEGLRPASIFIVLGLHDKKKLDDVYIYNAVEFFIHPKYEEEAEPPINDAAIIKTQEKVNFEIKVTPICLPPVKNFDYRGTKALIAGWGAKMYKGTSSDVLLKTKIDIMSDNDCAVSNIGKHFIKNLMICGYMKKADACQGDSGGPLMTQNRQNRYELGGIISFGIGCGSDNMPGIYTNVAYYMDWVQSIIGDTRRCGNTETIARRTQATSKRNLESDDKVTILRYLDALKRKIISEKK